MKYLLDSDVFIQAKNLHYGMDFCPAFWDWLDQQNKMGKVFSIEKVGDELHAGNDELSPWASDRGAEFFLVPDPKINASLIHVSNWVTGQKYAPSAVHTFLQVADYYLIAHAHAHQYVVITHEVAAASIKSVKIPNVCHGIGVKCMTPFEMLRHERARFVLGAKS